METQIIAFINSKKFSRLLATKGKDIGFYKINEDGERIFLEGNKFVVLVDINGVTTINEFEKIDPNRASLILVPDEKLIQYIPKLSFKILIHGETKNSYPNQFLDLKKNANCKACFEDKEEPNTIYQKIADFINAGGQGNYQKIWEAIPEIDYVLEAKLELLHNCLHHESVPQALDILLSAYIADFAKFNKEREGKTLFDKEYIEALTKLRKALLGS